MARVMATNWEIRSDLMMEKERDLLMVRKKPVLLDLCLEILMEIVTGSRLD